MGRLLHPRVLLAAMLIITIFLAVKAWHDTTAEPEKRRATIAISGLTNPVRIALISDIHVAGPDMPPERLTRIVKQINALDADLVLIAGDFVSDKRTATHIYSVAESVAPLSGLQARWGVIAVPGNHDHWRDMDTMRSALRSEGVRLLENEAVRAGPLAIGGLDDDFTGHADIPETVDAMRRLNAPMILLSHSPDPFPDTPTDVSLMLAGHTHCGQIAFPWGGSPATMSRYGQRYACGRVEEAGRMLITGAGLGTSVLPIRLFTRAEIWMITLTPE